MTEKYAVLDTTGEVCSIPLVKARRSLDKLEKGGRLMIIGTDDASKVDIIKAAKELKMEVVKLETDEDGRWRIFIRRPDT